MAATRLRRARHRSARPVGRSVSARSTPGSSLRKPAHQSWISIGVMSEKPSFFSELKRLNVYKIGNRVPVVQLLMFVLIKEHLLWPESSIPNERPLLAC